MSDLNELALTQLANLARGHARRRAGTEQRGAAACGFAGSVRVPPQAPLVETVGYSPYGAVLSQPF